MKVTSAQLNDMREHFAEVAAYSVANEEVPEDVLASAILSGVDVTEANLIGELIGLHLERIVEGDGEDTPLFDLTEFGQRVLEDEGEPCPTCGIISHSINL